MESGWKLIVCGVSPAAVTKFQSFNEEIFRFRFDAQSESCFFGGGATF